MRGLAPVEVGIELGVRRHLRPRTVKRVLIRDDGRVLGRQRDGGGHGLVLGQRDGPHVVAVAGLVAGPDEVVPPEDLRPKDSLQPRLEPVHQAIVGTLGDAGGVELRTGAARGKVDMVVREAWSLLDLLGPEVSKAAALRWKQPLTQLAFHVERQGLLDDVHDFKSQGNAGLAVLACVAQQLDEDPALVVVGIEEALGLVVPERPQLPEHGVGVAVGRTRVAGAPVLGRHRARKAGVIDDVDGPHLGRGDGDGATQAAKLAFGPIHGSRRLAGASGDHVGHGVQEEDVGAVGDEAGAAAGVFVGVWKGGSRVGLGLSPRDLDGTRLDGMHGPGVRTPVVARVRMAVGRVGLRQPVPFLEDVQRQAGLVEVRHRDHAAEGIGRRPFKKGSANGPFLGQEDGRVGTAEGQGGQLHVHPRVGKRRGPVQERGTGPRDPVPWHGTATVRRPSAELTRARLIEAPRFGLGARCRRAAIRARRNTGLARERQTRCLPDVDLLAGNVGLDGQGLGGMEHGGGRQACRPGKEDSGQDAPGCKPRTGAADRRVGRMRVHGSRFSRNLGRGKGCHGLLDAHDEREDIEGRQDVAGRTRARNLGDEGRQGEGVTVPSVLGRRDRV